jgi:hypothetical protein
MTGDADHRRQTGFESGVIAVVPHRQRCEPH